MSKQDKATTERHSRILRELVKRPDNKVCADCKRTDPRWASWNLGVFLCIRCSGIHRSMGTHISKVKSVDLDVWTPEQMQSVQKWGNHRANLYWEAHLKAGHVPPDHKVESFIRSKYESRRWAMEGPPPDDPSVLEEGQPATTSQFAQEVVEAPAPKPTPVTATGTTSRTAHPLLSTSMMSANRRQTPGASTRSPPPAPTPPPVQQQAPAPVDDLFSLDFHAPPTTTTASPAATAPRKDVKNDIMSLFSANPAPAVPAVPNGTSVWGGGNAWGQPQQPIAADPWGSFSSAPPALAATNGASFFGGSSGFGAPTQPVAQNVWANPAPSQQPAFGGGMWGAPTVTQAAPSQPAAKKDDAFGDLWN